MISLIIAGGIFALILLIIVAQLNKEKHFALRLLFIAVALLMLIIVGKGALDANEKCENVINQTIEYTNATSHTITEHTYSNVCYDTTNSSTANLLYKIANYLMLIFTGYIIYYFFFYLVTEGGLKKAMQKLNSIRRKKR